MCFLLHLVYNNSLLVKSSCSDNENECMASISNKKGAELGEKCRLQKDCKNWGPGML